MIRVLAILLKAKKAFRGFQITRLLGLLLYLIDNKDKFDDILDFIWEHLRNEPTKPK